MNTFRRVKKLFAVMRLALAGSVVAGLGSAQQGAYVERAGKHFRVVLHRGDTEPELAARLADLARNELERWWQELEASVGARADLHTVHLYRDAAEYSVLEKAQNPFRFSTSIQPGEVMNTWSATNGFVGKDGQGYLRLAPALSAPILGELGLPEPTRIAMCRIACELLIRPLVPDSPAHEFLFWVLVMGESERLTNPRLEYGVDGEFDSRRESVVGRRGLGHEFTLDRSVSASMEWQERWQWQVDLVDFAILAQHLRETDPRWAKKLLAWRSKSRTRGGEIELRKAAIGSVVGRDWSAAAARFVTMVEAFAPRWAAFRDVWVPGKRSLLVGTAEIDAGVSNARKHVAGDFAVAARVELGPGSQVPLLFRIGYGHEGSATAWIHAGRVGIGVFEGDPSKWKDKVQAEVGIQPGRAFEARIEARPGEVRLLIDGGQVCTWKHEMRTPEGRVDLMVRDRMIWLENLQIESLGPAKNGK